MSLSNFISAVWSSRIQKNIQTNLVANSIVNRDYEGEVSRNGSVRINAHGAITIFDYTANTDMAGAEELTSSQRILVIDKAKGFNFQVDDVDAAQMNVTIMDSAMADAGYRQAKVADGLILAAGIAGAGANLGTIALASTPSLAYDAIVALGVSLDETDTPENDRFAVVAPGFYGNLLKDIRFIRATAQGDRVLASGEVGEVDGITIYKSNQIGAHNLLAGQRAAITLADQVDEVEAYRPQLRFADAVKGLYLYGFKVVRPEYLVKAVWTA